MIDTMDGGLRPCPFCGREAVVMEAVTGDGGKTCVAMCRWCGIAVFKPGVRDGEWNALRTAQDAAEAWNRRAE